MHNEWQDLLPFYVSGQISDSERAIVEQALQDSEECRQALSDWKRVASLVRKEAGIWGDSLPPLYDRVRSAARTPSTQIHLKPVADESMAATSPISIRHQLRAIPQVDRPSRTMNLPIPLTLVASILMVVLMGGLLITFWRSGPEEPQFGAGSDATVIAAQVTETQRDDLGILSVPEPTALPSWATNTVSPELAQINSMSNFQEGCFAVSSTGQEVRIYNAPDSTSSIITTLSPDMPQEIRFFDPSGWYELSSANGTTLGWVRAIEIMLSGTCDSIPRSTTVPDAPDSADNCTVSPLNSEPVELYIEPDEGSTVIQTIRDFSSTYVVGRLDGGMWYRVRYDSLGSIWVGWIRAERAAFSAECQTLRALRLSSPSDTTMPDVVTLTPVAVPELQSFAAPMTDVAQRGSWVRLEWRALNTPRVAIEFYSADVAIEDYGVVEPLAAYDNLLPEGNLDVIIPASYAHPRAVFVLIMARSDGTRGPTGILVIPIER